MKRQNITPIVIASISLFLVNLTFAALPRYEIIDLGTLDGSYSSAHAINDAGQVVGISGGPDHAFLWDISTGMIDLGTLPGQSHSSAEGINDWGQVVGDTIGIYEFVAFIWDSEKGMQYLDGIGTRESTAFDINNRGQVVGEVGYAFLWDPDKGLIDLSSTFGIYNAYAINNAGQLVGNKRSTDGLSIYAVLWDPIIGVRDLGTLGGRYSTAYGINDAGHVVGKSHTQTGDWHAFLWDSINGMTDLGPGIARVINDAGQIVGYLNPRGPSVPFYWDIDNGMIKLNDLLPPGSMWKVLKFAFDINNRGQIVGQGITNSGKTLAFLMIPVSPKIIYVDADATGTNDGSSWADAFNYLQDALAAAYNGDEIWVAEGIYKPDQGEGVTPCDRTATFQLINGVTLKGGYAGFGESNPNARDIRLYETILSGDLNGDDKGVNVPCNLLNGPCRAENSYHVVTAIETDETAVLDGFTITAGNADGLYKYGQNTGGGVYCGGTGSFVLNNCIICDNTAKSGGAISGSYYGQSRLMKCTVTRNAASYAGGGICGFVGTIIETMIVGNSAGVRGGGISWCHGSITDCIIAFNSSDAEGGGLYGCGGSMNNCLVTGNRASEGGGMYCEFECLTLTNCIFTGNSAQHFGGIAIYSYECTLTLNNSILWHNCDVGGMDESAQIESRSAPETPIVNYSCIQGWTGDLGGTGNIGANPCFVDLGYWNANGVWIEGDYHLLQSSPCIDAGDPNYVAEPNETDLDGRPRVIGGRVDMGAYESPLPAEVRIVPRTINLTSKGNWITCYIWLPEEYNVADIDPNSVLLEGEIKPEEFSVDEQKQVAVLRFSREEVQPILEVGEVELTITGRLVDGTVFEATDLIRVISRGGGKPAN